MEKIKTLKKLWASPSILGKHGKGLWDRIGKQLVLSATLSELDKETFVALCIAYDTMMGARELLKGEGLVIRGDQASDSKKKHPAFSIFRAAMNDFYHLADRFGLSPISRGKVGIETEKGMVDDEKKKFFPNE